MQDRQRLSLEQIRAFFEGSQDLEFQASNRQEGYAWVGRTLAEQEYLRLGREGKGLVRCYISKMTGLSRAHVTRLIGQHKERAEVGAKTYRRHRFATRYSAQDIALLVQVDEAHETLTGPATQKLLQRAYHGFHDWGYLNLARISVAHLYRFQATRAYRQQRVVCQPT